MCFVSVLTNKKVLAALVVAAIITICAITIPVVIVTSSGDGDPEPFVGREILDEVPLIDGYAKLEGFMKVLRSSNSFVCF